VVDDGSDEYDSEQEQDEYEEEDSRPSKRSKGGYKGRKFSTAGRVSSLAYSSGINR
jgi:hypothetical protein